MNERAQAISVLVLNTLAFGVCFAAWTMNGVLVTFLVDQGVFKWTDVQIGWLIGIPILTGSIMRLPVGILTDKYGGRVVYTILMLLSAVPMYAVSLSNSYGAFLLTSLGFGLTGASFAVGVAYTSLWFKKERQGTALGIFGIGNVGAAMTSMTAPSILTRLTGDGAHLDAWRTLPQAYAAALVVMAVVFFILTHPKKAEGGATLRERLQPLRYSRVWRFGLYYFLVFGGFVGLSQWLIPYYVNAYAMSVTTAGLMAAAFSLPSGLVRAVGGWLSDRYGPRKVMYVVLTGTSVVCVLLTVPRMDVESPGKGVMALRPGVVTAVSNDAVVVGDRRYSLRARPEGWQDQHDLRTVVFPNSIFWQQPVVQVGDRVEKRQLLARGVTHIYFQANVRIFSGLVLLVAVFMGLGMGAVYKLIPDYFPRDVGVVGGIVGVIGGLGGFLSPILFGSFLQRTGIWTTSWMFLGLLALACLFWMHLVIQRMQQARSPQIAKSIDERHTAAAPAAPPAWGASGGLVAKPREIVS